MGSLEEQQTQSAAHHPVEVEIKNGSIPEATLEFLRDEDTAIVIDINEKTLVRKIDWMIMPLMWAAYNLQYLDKISIS